MGIYTRYINQRSVCFFYFFHEDFLQGYLLRKLFKCYTFIMFLKFICIFLQTCKSYKVLPAIALFLYLQKIVLDQVMELIEQDLVASI